MFVEDPPNYRVVDHERDVALKLLFSHSRDINFFVLDWGGRRIPFWADREIGRDPASGTETLLWKVQSIGIGHIDGLPERTVQTYHFTSATEREAATALILESLLIYGDGVRNPFPLLVEVVLDSKEQRKP